LPDEETKTMDPIIRPRNGLLLIALQPGEGQDVTLDPALHAVAFEDGSISYGSPFTMEGVSEVTGSLVGSAPLIIGQQSPFSFRSRIKGAGSGVTYTASIKPPLHAALQGCGMRGQFMAAVAATALAAGSATTATLAAPFVATAQAYRGLPLVLSVGPGAGSVPFITDYTAGRVATLSESFSPVLSTSTLAAIPANWSYAGTSPVDVAARNTDHPVVKIGYYEDGNLHQWLDCRGVADFDGVTARPGFGTFRFLGTYLGKSEAAVPANAVVATHSAPLLVKGTSAGAPPVALINRKPLAISRWGVRNGGEVGTIEDPNTPYGFGAGQLGGRTPMFDADPFETHAGTRNSIAEIEAGSVQPISLRFGSVAGNRFGLTLPGAQIAGNEPGMRGEFRSESLTFQALSAGRDAYGRDGDRILTFF
jgi:hypothetical protein